MPRARTTATPRRSTTDRLLTLPAAAPRIGYSADYVRRWIKPGNTRPNPPPFFKLPGGQWRISERDLDEWIAARFEAIESVA